MALYSVESDIIVKRYTRRQRINGGKNRASTAKRDRWGRMLPKDDTVLLPMPVAHGVKAGLCRVSNCKRDCKGRFVKC